MGLLMVYTGEGKGKTTAALGQVFRAMGRGWRCCVIQFIKADAETGEALFAQKLELLDFKTLGAGFVFHKTHGRAQPAEDLEPHRRAARSAWEEAVKILSSDAYKLVVLDELTYPVSFGFLDIEEILMVLDKRPESVNVIITGRGAPDKLIEKADLVTEMKQIKHPMDLGLRAKEGIEY